jgi:hypothetical protein
MLVVNYVGGILLTNMHALHVRPLRSDCSNGSRKVKNWCYGLSFNTLP